MAKYLVPKMKDHLYDQTDEGATALHFAVQCGHINVVEYFVMECGFQVTAKCKVCY